MSILTRHPAGGRRRLPPSPPRGGLPLTRAPATGLTHNHRRPLAAALRRLLAACPAHDGEGHHHGGGGRRLVRLKLVAPPAQPSRNVAEDEPSRAGE
eukprot:CAMPEP_0185337608 /NCGR_PEP_ID=MMETSP1363-20130426/93270_1 /TAXON_ID=38817 /ORGANISM="Gephyrocapsa oceanica, Strain RCC1303" /LENGTH=96 /DNA_ID=CAMNT_0027936759 /DNA_START=117 /DNA_END=408 /DNA_ORIENTATION=+